MEELISTLMQNAIQNGETITPYEVEYTRSSMQREINNLREAIDDFNSTLSSENADFEITNDGEKIGQFISLMKARAEKGTIDFKNITQSESLAAEMKIFAEDMFLQNRVDTLYGRAVDAGIKGALAAAFVGLSAQEIAKTKLFQSHTIEALIELGAEIGTEALTELYKSKGVDERDAEADASLVQGTVQKEVDFDSSISIRNDQYAKWISEHVIDQTQLMGGEFESLDTKNQRIGEALHVLFQTKPTPDGFYDLESVREEIGEPMFRALGNLRKIPIRDLTLFYEKSKELAEMHEFKKIGKDEKEIKKNYLLFTAEHQERLTGIAREIGSMSNYVISKQKNEFYVGLRDDQMMANAFDERVDTYMDMIPDFHNPTPEIIEEPSEIEIDSKGYVISKVFEYFKQKPDHDVIMAALNGKTTPEFEQNSIEGTTIEEVSNEEAQTGEATEDIDLDSIPGLGSSGADILDGLDQIAAQVLSEKTQMPNMQESFVPVGQDFGNPEELTFNAQEMTSGDTLDFLRRAAVEVTSEQEVTEEPIQEVPDKPTLKGAIEEFQYQRKFGRGLFGATAGLMGNLGAVMVGSVRNSFSRIFNRQKALPSPTNNPQEVKGISQSAIVPQPEAELEQSQPQQVEAPEIIPPDSVIPGIISHETRNSFIPRVTVDEKAVIAQMEARKQEQQGIEQGDGQTPQEPNDFINDFQMD